mmetsp:Transcript_33844/g.84330  ORF Transcript_33844/g.84330 Transcript_33844/m.84330 type:complete len:268 (+) Transcript_33844:531-1334(+)
MGPSRQRRTTPSSAPHTIVSFVIDTHRTSPSNPGVGASHSRASSAPLDSSGERSAPRLHTHTHTWPHSRGTPPPTSSAGVEASARSRPCACTAQCEQCSVAASAWRAARWTRRVWSSPPLKVCHPRTAKAYAAARWPTVRQKAPDDAHSSTLPSVIAQATRCSPTAMAATQTPCCTSIFVSSAAAPPPVSACTSLCTSPGRAGQHLKREAAGPSPGCISRLTTNSPRAPQYARDERVSSSRRISCALSKGDCAVPPRRSRYTPHAPS